jgi:group I intron endonuclease
MVGIYKITNPKGKVYIGQSVNIPSRKNKYTLNHTKGQPKISRSITKYGFENHLFEIIEECSIEQLNEKETYWKQYYLNQMDGNWNMVLFCNLYDTGGGPKSDIWKKSKSRPILQYDLDGNFVKEWASAKHFAEVKGLTNGTLITRCLKEKTKTAYGYLWKYFSPNYPIKISHVMLEYEKMKISQYDISENLVAEWDSILEAATSLNFNQQNIVNNLKKRSKSAYGYIWKYKE